MDPDELLARLSTLLWDLADSAARSLGAALTLAELPGEIDPALQGRLLEPLTSLPDQHALLRLVRDVIGDPTAAGSPIRAHGWRHAPGSAPGLALVLTEGTSRMVLAASPGPIVDLVVTAGTAVDRQLPHGEWTVRVEVKAQEAWSATFSRGGAAVAPAGSATIRFVREGRLTLGVEDGPHVAVEQRIEVVLRATPQTPLQVELDVVGFVASVLPPALAAFVAAGRATATRPTTLPLRASRAEGLRFKDTGVRIDLPVGLDLPGVTTRGFAVELSTADGGFALSPTLSLLVKPPALPLTADIAGVGARVPLAIGPEHIGFHPDAGVDATPPTGMGIDLQLGPVAGGGTLLRRGEDAYAGAMDVDLGVVAVTAFGLLQLPVAGNPLSLLVLLGADFPYPGMQLSFGFALDAVGGLIGINRRADDEGLKALVLEGNADRIMFPGNAVARADEIAGSLERCFPVARGRFVVGPMVRINWGGRIVTLSASVLLELPDPGRVLLLGRMLVALPDPAVPLIRLQASLLGRIDPGVPLVDFLVSLSGSWIVGTPVTGELYVLMRGGADPMLVLSAGGFHPRYSRPAGVPELRRLAMDLGGGALGLRAEAYIALTSNSLQFGAKLHLDATIAGCGLEGWLGLDALFVWEPALAFSAHVYAGIAVLAFGRRLASVGLDFTLEGPAPWHAFGSGSISVLFWDVALDFDVRWGDPAPLPRSPDDIPKILGEVVARAEAWAVERPVTQRAGLRFTATAKEELAKGLVVQPDAQLRFNQTVVPLDVPITRFHRLGVPEQTWTITSIELERDNPVPGAPRKDLFVGGEFFALSEDEQLTLPAMTLCTSGSTLADTDVEPGAAHLVDDDYETGYQVEAGWFSSPPQKRLRLRMRRAPFAYELFARPITSAERIDRWRLAQRPLDGLAPKVTVTR